MITELINQFANNQFLTAGVGTTIAASLLYVIKSLPMQLFNQIKNMITSELRVVSYRHDYESINAFLLTIRNDMFSRNYSIGNDNTKLISGYGRSVAFFKGKLIIYEKSRIDSQGVSMDNLVLRFYTRKKEVIQDFLIAAENNVDKDKIKIFRNHHGGWNELTNSLRSRDISTVFVNNHIKEELVSSIEKFIDSESYYVRHGIPYKFCAILSGIPGTGKSSLAFALASHFKKKVYYISSLSNIDNQFETVSEDSIVFIEDVDCLNSVKRDNEYPGIGESEEKDIPLAALDKMNFHSMLNSLDGVLVPHGLIVIMTTNYLENLDKALTRKGRVDKIVSIDPLNEETMHDMVRHFYPTMDVKLFNDYNNFTYHCNLTGAEIQSILMEEENVVGALGKIYQGKSKTGD